MRLNILYLLLALSVLSGCYSFKGTSIPPEAKTYVVLDFIKSDPAAPIDIENRFSEALRDKIRNESRLKYSEIDPDIQFEGSISKYHIDYEAPDEGTTVDLGKLTITVKVEYQSNVIEKDKWNKTYNKFRTYASNENLSDIEDELIDEIFDQITEAVFNDAFSSW